MKLATENPEIMGKLIGRLPDQRRERVAKNLQTIINNLPPWRKWLAKRHLSKVRKQSLEGLGFDITNYTYTPSVIPSPDIPSTTTNKEESSSFDWGALGKTLGTVVGVGATLYTGSEQRKLAEDQAKMQQQRETLSLMMDMTQQNRLMNLQESRVQSQNRIDQAQADIFLAQAELEKLKVEGQIQDINAARAAQQRILDAQTRLQEVSINEKAAQIEMENEQRRMLIEAGINPDTVLGRKTNWLLWGGIGVAAIGAGTFLFIKRKTIFKRRGRKRK